MKVWLVEVSTCRTRVFKEEAKALELYYKLIEEIIVEEDLYRWYEEDLQEDDVIEIGKPGFSLEDIQAHTPAVRDMCYEWFLDEGNVDENNEELIYIYEVEMEE